MNTSVQHQLEVTAKIYPACECGLPWQSHGTCGGYKPSRPIEDLGTVAFRSRDFIASTLWMVEKFIQKLRLKRIQSWRSV